MNWAVLDSKFNRAQLFALALALLPVGSARALGDTVSNPEKVATLPGSPGAMASDGTTILLADRRGSVLWWRWPGTADSSFKAHDDGGPAIAGTGWFATAGGWDPQVKRWEPGAAQAQLALQPFTGRITALCGQGDILLVAGANRPPTQANTDAKDRAPLLPSEVIAIAKSGSTTRVPLATSGAITALACGPDWVAAIDDGVPSKLHARSGLRSFDIPLQQGPATAITARGDALLAADGKGIWEIEPRTGTRRLLFKTPPHSLRVLSLLVIGDHVFGATSEGVIRWPQGSIWKHGTSQPTAMSRHGESLLVLWDSGALTQYEPRSGKIVADREITRVP